MAASIADQVRRETYNALIATDQARPFDQIRQRELYSTYLFAPGTNGVIPAGTYDLFKTTKGQTGQGYANMLTERETNWALSGQLSSNQNLVFKSIHAEIKRAPTEIGCYDPAVRPAVVGTAVTGKVDVRVPPHPADVLAVASGMILVVTFLTDRIPIGLVADFPSPGGVVGYNSAGRQYAGAVGAAPAFATTAATAGARPYLPISRNACNALFERRFKIPQLLRNGDVFGMSLLVPTAIPLLDINNTAVEGNNNDASGCLEVRLGIFATESFDEKS